ncbi:MAG: PKD domain-containing protein [Gammaproteobacteria bacterium]|nr:PKD domain-containing protein [Gammaproteobacteria bacterium]
MAVANADVTAGKAPLVVNFDASSSSDPDGSIASYHWDFMDGNFSSEVKPVHEFTATGKYQVTLTVIDDLGMSASSSIAITVRKGKRK